MDLQEKDFEEKVLKGEGPILVDFWATWCGPCQALSPTINQVEQELAGKSKVFKVDVDQNRSLAQKYNIRSVPTLLFFKDGKVVKSLLGTQSKDELVRSLQELL